MNNLIFIGLTITVFFEFTSVNGIFDERFHENAVIPENDVDRRSGAYEIAEDSINSGDSPAIDPSVSSGSYAQNHQLKHYPLVVKRRFPRIWKRDSDGWTGDSWRTRGAAEAVDVESIPRGSLVPLTKRAPYIRFRPKRYSDWTGDSWIKRSDEEEVNVEDVPDEEIDWAKRPAFTCGRSGQYVKNPQGCPDRTAALCICTGVGRASCYNGCSLTYP